MTCAWYSIWIDLWVCDFGLNTNFFNRIVTAITFTYFTYLLEKQFQGFHLQDLVNVLRVELDPEVEPHEIAVLFHILASTDKHIFLGFSRPNMEI